MLCICLVILMIACAHSACVDRRTMIARGQDWVNRQIPYSQTGTEGGYRTDCSGFISMCWGLDKPGKPTSGFGSVSTKITKDSLVGGDALVCPGTHITLFVEWADSSKSHYIGME